MKILRALGYILAALVAVAVPTAIMRLGIVPVLGDFLSLDETALSILRRTGMIAAFAFGYWLYVRLIEKRPARELSLRPATIATSAAAGALSIGLPVGFLFVTGAYFIVSTGIDYSAMFGILLVIAAAALFEEILFRAILFAILERFFGLWAALLVPSVLFSVLHVFNDDWGGWLPIAIGIALGLMWSMVYVVTRNVWAAAANHAAWNTVIFLSGLPLTGQQEWREAAPLHSDYTGPAWLTGGAAGPESTVLVLGVVSLISAFLVFRKSAHAPAPSAVSRQDPGKAST